MRNLKKILSLALALMMVLSVMVTASATTFKDDADFDSYLEEIAPDITAMAALAPRNGAAVGAPFGSQGSNTAANELVKARFEAAAKADVAPAIAGLPTNNP